ncbi:MAG TPA: hypothetical protein VFG76_07740, partial [Candidatus Polarisedimenticolia bacterium]|nr:hypothetical protein [Candidatus Polarisedimenticolia bacterium]
GGFGHRARYLNPYALELAATLYHRGGDQAMLRALLTTLREMEHGAIYDRVGGGFHRFTSDPAWRRPELEKLLSYNSAVLSAYVLGYGATGDRDLLGVANKTADYLLETLRDPNGGFFVAQWASGSSEEPKGLYYAWTDEEFGRVVPQKQAALARLLFPVTAQGDLLLGPPPRSFLYLTMRREELSARLGLTDDALRGAEAEVLSALAAARHSRQAPPIERAVYVDSTSAAVWALLDLSRVTGRQDARQAAQEALDRMLAAVPQGRPMLHRLEPPPEIGADPALALDHVMLARAALLAFEVTGQARYLAAARDVTDRALGLFWDPDRGFYDVVSDPKAPGYLPIRRALPADTAYPSLNSVAAQVLDRISLLTGDPSYRARAETCLKNHTAAVKTPSFQQAGLALAIEAHLRTSTTYVVVGGDEDARTRELRAFASKLFDPGKVILGLSPGRDDPEIARWGLQKSKEPYIAVCDGARCSVPARSEAALKEALSGLARGSRGTAGAVD